MKNITQTIQKIAKTTMKQSKTRTIILFLFSICFIILANREVAYAITKGTPSLSPSTSPTTTASSSANSDLMNKIDQQINSLKTRIASRVAQLNLVEKRGIIGVVSGTSGTQIKLKDIHNNIRFIDVDELTKFSSSSTKGSFGLSDLTKGMLVGVLGNYNKDSQRILARFIDVVSFPQIVSGNVDTIDKKNYQFTVTTPDNKSHLIDVETITKTYAYTTSDGEKKSGFSKINTDERVYVVGFPDKTNANMLVASRIILFPELSPTVSTSPTTSVTPTPTKKK